MELGKTLFPKALFPFFNLSRIGTKNKVLKRI